jgi:hypothetical protein
MLGKYLLLKTNGELQEIDNTNGELFDCTDKKFNDFVHKTINCDCYESVYPVPFRKYNIVMLVDESGLLKCKPVNPHAWRIYSGMNFDAPIVGDVLFCGECYEDFGEGFPEHDFCALNHVQMNILKLALSI